MDNKIRIEYEQDVSFWKRSYYEVEEERARLEEELKKVTEVLEILRDFLSSSEEKERKLLAEQSYSW